MDRLATSPSNVVIIGGSLSGLMQGIVLHRLGHRVHVLERSLMLPEGRGAGINCRKHTQEFFDKWDLTKVSCYINSDEIRLLNREGVVSRAWNIPMKTTSWMSLYYKLRINFDGLQSEYYPEKIEAFQTTGEARYELGQTVTNVQYRDDRITIEYEATGGGGKKLLQPDLVIAADGSRSRIRHILQPGLIPKYAGYIAWRGMVPENKLSEEFRGFYGGRTSLYPMGNGHFLIYLIPGESGSIKPGDRYFNWLWYCNYPEDSKELIEIMTDDAGQVYRNSMPIGKICSPIWNRQKAIATGSLPSQLAEVVQKTLEPFISSINDLRSPRASFFDGKLLMVGDALTCCRPHVPSSTEQAAFNALLLHELLQGNISSAEWEDRVLHFSQAAFLLSKSFGLYWQYGLTFEFLITLLCFGWVKLYGQLVRAAVSFFNFITGLSK